MPQEQENIEARLCAYIDGELEPSERAQLEKTLRANPDHARLMADLVCLRGWVGQMPRTPAPADLAETVQAHMERGMLLGSGSVEGAPVRLNYWPRLIAAAILLLASGLIGVIYWTLSKSNTQVAIFSKDGKTVVAQDNESVDKPRTAKRDRSVADEADDKTLSRTWPSPARIAPAEPATREADRAALADNTNLRALAQTSRIWPTPKMWRRQERICLRKPPNRRSFWPRRPPMRRFTWSFTATTCRAPTKSSLPFF